MSEDRLPFKFASSWIQGINRPPGRPTSDLTSRVKDALKRKAISTDYAIWSKLAQDRPGWLNLINGREPKQRSNSSSPGVISGTGASGSGNHNTAPSQQPVTRRTRRTSRTSTAAAAQSLLHDNGDASRCVCPSYTVVNQGFRGRYSHVFANGTRINFSANGTRIDD